MLTLALQVGCLPAESGPALAVDAPIGIDLAVLVDTARVLAPRFRIGVLG